MFRRLFIILLLFPCLALRGQDFAPLDSLMDIYVVAVQKEAPEQKIAETDYMIASAKDSLTRQHIALRLFDYYKESPLMGEEEIAVHIYDEWIASGRIAARSEFEKMDAKLFADFNRSSLLGMDAPQILLRRPCGSKMTVPQKGRSALIWFFDTACAKCRMEARLLPGILEEGVTQPLDFYAVYSGTSRADWRKFRRDFRIKNKNIRLLHLWDPEIESDYLRLYGVISTPKLYMTEPSGAIIGRRLELDNLPEMFRLGEIISKSNHK